DVDHDQDMKLEPFVTMQEAIYLMEGLNYVLPDLDISFNDCISSIAGVRPVLSKKKQAASKESREHVVWKDKGLVTVTGGKLTTFRLLANDALKAARPYLPGQLFNKPELIMQDLKWNETCKTASRELQEKLLGRYGHVAHQMIKQYDEKLFSPIDQTESLWVELCHGAEHENVHHLSDLLLRRIRIGLFLPKGGISLLNKIEAMCKPYLSWDSEKWDTEKKAYIKVWNKYYSPPNKNKEL
ncbi:MAG: FAD-dependent oxidoreductase, partial [Desulfobacteraceae bacterium]|nr:FAD-dependent oxidoreductase [Desulfobacteraceae bacterium]